MDIAVRLEKAGGPDVLVAQPLGKLKPNSLR